MLTNKLKGIIFMVLSGACYGLVWIFSKGVVDALPPLLFTTLRMLAAAIVFWIIGIRFWPQLEKMKKKDLTWLVMASLCGVFFMAIFFTLAIKLTTVTNASFLFFVPATFLPLLGLLDKRFKFDLYTTGVIIFCILGLWFLFSPDIGSTSIYGNIFAVLAGLSNVIYLVLLKRVARLPASLNGMVVFGIVVVVLAIVTLIFEPIDLSILTIPTLIHIGYIGISIAGAYLFMTIGLRYLSQYVVGVLVVFEPVFAVLFAVLFFGEILINNTIYGLVCIIISFALLQLSKSE